ncbi:hypothetical protein DID78_07260, partial [Candidatus Marinamargulisbacteria bacterium SCGC AG-343-D04]
NKSSEVKSEDLKKIKGVIKALNPDAKCLETNYSDVGLTDVLNTGLFDFEKASEAAGWLKEMRGEHIPETEEYNISSLSFKSKRPFHPKRFMDFVQSNLDGIYRVKGCFWLATRMEFVGQVSIAGKLAEISPAGKWWAAVPKIEWDLEDEEMIKSIQENWEEPYGDRRQELVFIGTGVDKEGIRRKLESCLLTDKEFSLGPEVWAGYEDPIPAWEFIEEESDVEEESLVH